MEPVPEAAAQIIVTIIPIVGIVMGCGVVFFYLLWNHKQKMLMIERGINKRIPFDFDTFSLFTGFVLTGIGAALTFFFWVKEGVDYSLLGGLMPLSIGISMSLFYMASKNRTTGQ